MKNTKLKAALIAVTLIAIVSTTFAALQYVHYVQNTAMIVAVYGVKVVRLDDINVVIDAIPWGSFQPGQEKITYDVFGTSCNLANRDNMDIYVVWELDPDTPLPSGVALTAWKCYTYAPVLYEEWHAIDSPQYTKGVDALPIAHGKDVATEQGFCINWKLSVPASAVPQSFNFTIWVEAHDVAP